MVKNCGQLYDFIIDLTISVFQFRFMPTFMRKLIKFGLFQLGWKVAHWNVKRLQKKLPPKFLDIFFFKR